MFIIISIIYYFIIFLIIQMVYVDKLTCLLILAFNAELKPV